MSKQIKVKALPGRVARVSPDGPFIPEDRFIPVVRTRYIERLLNVHGDIVQEPQVEKPADKTKPAPKAETPPAKEEK